MKKLILSALRNLRHFIYRLLDSYPPFITHRNYLGFFLFYKKGPGIVDRLRFLSPKKIYEEKLCLQVISHLENKKKPVFLDVGANIGLISLYITKKTPEVLIYALEPGLLQRSLFGLTINKNKLENKIKLYPYALSDYSGQTSFVTYEKAVDGIGDGLIETERVLYKSRPIQVEVTTLDDFVSQYEINHIDVVKIDIEGAELLAFKGAENTLTKHRPVVYFELNSLNLKNYSHTAEETFLFLQKLEYKIYTLDHTECSLENISLLMQRDDTFVAIP